MITSKPKEGECNPQWGVYMEHVEEGNLLQLLKEQEADILAVYKSLSEEQSLYRYAEGKWSLKEVLGHIMDVERIASYRLLIAGRDDTTPLPRHQDVHVHATNFDRRSLEELLAEFIAVRTATIALVRGLTSDSPSCWSGQQFHNNCSS
ncbi:DinB family protein [Paenibacillus sp. GSMTC-2017]|uniref:DinB family protein n=1 Tax=Paenibacillus sp. GSMTC-2017 TaxID=2794350 RepID=UPI001E5E53CD|nr:DinB family protein [Paenibacillus sp. GSMTC-2017]